MDGTILSLDDSVAEMLQRPRRELIGSCYTTITHRHDHVRNAMAMTGLSRDRSRFAIRKRYLRADNSVLWVDLAVSRLKDPAGEGMLIGTIHTVDMAIDAGNPARNWHSARREVGAIDRRRRLLGEELYTDHVWLLLLNIYLAESEGRNIDIDALSEAVELSRAMVRRWLGTLVRRRLIDLIGACEDVPQLTRAGLASVEGLLEPRSEPHFSLI